MHTGAVSSRVQIRPGSVDGHALLREMVAELTGLDVATIAITASCPDCGGTHGRPTVVGHPELHVSLARTPGYVVAAVSGGASSKGGGPIGVDVELIAGSPERAAAVGALTGIQSLTHWTRVEAVLKADGRGLRVDPALVQVNGDIATLEGVRYRLSSLDLDSAVVVTLAERL